MPKRKKVGLALGSGGPRGIAHIGVIEELVKHNIPIDVISGSSIGSWIGARYALDQDIEKLKDQTLSKKYEKLGTFFELKFSTGVAKGNKMESLLNRFFRQAKFSDLQIPFTAATTDLQSGKCIFINRGNIAHAVRISMSIPGFFSAVTNKKRLLVDGGVSNPLPAQILQKQGADIIIASNLNNASMLSKDAISLKTPLDAARQTYNILSYHLSQEQKEYADIIIEPNIRSGNISSLYDFFFDNKEQDFYKKGRLAARRMIPQIKQLL